MAIEVAVYLLLPLCTSHLVNHIDEPGLES
jgi:hypothetical protein